MAENMMFILFAGVGAVLLIVLAYIYIRDLESSKKLKMYEKSIEDLNMQLFKIHKKLKEKEVEEGLPGNNIHEIIKKELNKEMLQVDTKIKRALEELRGSIDELRYEIDERFDITDEKLKEANYVPTYSQNVDEGKIISMHSSGYSADEIARELRISKGEVEFTLKLANI